MPRKIGSNFTPKPVQRKYDFARMGVEPTGEVFLLEKGSDYSCSEAHLRGHIRQYAKDMNLQYASQVRRDGKRIVGVEVAFAPQGASLPDTRLKQAPAAAPAESPGVASGDGSGLREVA